MDSGTACGPVPDAPSSIPGAERDASASPPEVGPLRRSSDFRRVLASGRRSRRGAITVVGAKGAEGETRIGLVVRKDVGNAVRRNRAKRRIRHALTEVSLEQSMDYVIIADSRVVEAPFGDLTGWLRQAVDGLE